MPNAKVLAKKQSDVEALKEKFAGAKLVILADYRGINVDDVTKMRAELRKDENTEYLVAKNSTFRFAVKGTEYEGISEKLEGPTAVVFSTEDYVGPAKILYDYAKNSDFYKIKGGIMDGKVIDSEEIIKLAKYHQKKCYLHKLLQHCLLISETLLLYLIKLESKKKEQMLSFISCLFLKNCQF